MRYKHKNGANFITYFIDQSDSTDNKCLEGGAKAHSYGKNKGSNGI